MRRLRSFVLLRSLLALASLGACERAVRADDPRLRYEGRVRREEDGAVRITWPRGAVHLRFRGTRLAMRVEEQPFPGEIPQTDALGVEVDGGPLRRITLGRGVQRVELARGLAPAEHTVRVLKLTEAEVGTVRVLGVDLRDGATLLDPPPPRPRRLLAVGDSISVGYGVEGASRACRATAAMCDASRAWPSLAAEALGAELHVIAWSGRGLTRNYDPAQGETLLELARRTVATDPHARWDHARWPPTELVVNVGTNDVARAGFDDARYADALLALITDVLRRAPSARVRVLVGPMLFDDAPHPGAASLRRVREATDRVVRALASHGATDIARVDVAPADDAEGRGCEDHPNALTQRRIARALLASLAPPRGGLHEAPATSLRSSEIARRESAPWPAR